MSNRLIPRNLTKRRRETILDELVALQQALPDWTAEEIVHSTYESGEITFRLEKPQPEEYGYSEVKYRQDRDAKQHLKKRLKRTPWIWGGVLALVIGFVSYSFVTFQYYSFLIVIVSLIAGAIIGSIRQKSTWEKANNTRYSKLNEYEKELFGYVYWSRRRRTDFWRSLSGTAFEQELTMLFRLAGYQADVTPSSGDKGVDIVLVKDGQRGIVQCKAHKAQIGPNVVRELYGTAVHFDSEFTILASVSGFTPAAIQFAGEKSIILMALDDIVGMQDSIAKNEIIRHNKPVDELGEHASRQRVLYFPDDEVFGTIYIRDQAYRDSPLILVGEAFGRLIAPEDKTIHLRVGNPDNESVDYFPDLSPLDDLQPDDIQEIDLLSVNTEDDDLIHLSRLRGLRWLRIRGMDITDDAFLYLRELTSLRVLIVEFGQFSGSGLKYLDALIHLEELQLNGIIDFTETGLEYISHFMTLRKLSLYSTDMTASGLAHVQKLRNLEWLSLGSTLEIDENMICELAKLNRLRTLEISGFQVTEDILAKFAALLPNCKIVFL